MNNFVYTSERDIRLLAPDLMMNKQHNLLLNKSTNNIVSLRSLLVSSKQPKLGLMQEFVVLLVCACIVHWAVCLFVCLFDKQFR